MATILIVDDHPDVREVIGQMLAMHGDAIVLAASAESAWDQMLQSAPDAVIIDQRLPGMSGIEFLTRMRETPRFSSIPAVLCSGDDRERDAAKLAGAFEFWLKGSDGMFDAVARLSDKLRASLLRRPLDE